jgi:segregation and condensation protein A
MELAEFFSLASRLLLRKVRALMPGQEPETADDETEEDSGGDDVCGDDMDEETLRAALERFRPYRSAAALLMERKAERERCFARDAGEGGPPWFDIGDLHGLAAHWWGLIDDYSRRREARTESGFMMEVPDAVPEEILVEARMEEIRDVLAACSSATLRSLLERFGRDGLIVTLLALLEMSRLGQLGMTQAESWGDVEIAAA